MSGEKQYTRDWVTHKTATWSQLLGHLAGRPKIRGLEIGSCEGRSACWFLDHIFTETSSRLECVDKFRASQFFGAYEELFDENTAEYGKRIVKHKADSFAWLAGAILDARFGKFDFIYVDGDHRAHRALADFVLAWPLLKRGGILLADDYPITPPEGEAPLSMAWDGFVSTTPDCEPILTEGWQRAARKQ